MHAVIPLVLLAISVKQDGTRLREGCATDQPPVATLSAGTPLVIRFAVSGESVPCYKVAAESGNKTLAGYLSAAEIEGLDAFDQARRDAAWLDPDHLMEAARASAPAPSSGGLAASASQLIESGQPSKALEILKPELKQRKDAGLLALAGLAAWKSDDARGALEYWRGSLALRPNADLESLVRRVERESQGDQSTEKLVGMRVLLRYDRAIVSADTARTMLAALDEEYLRLSQRLGCAAQERITAIVQSQDAYRRTTNAAEWSGGLFDGRIRVPVLNGQNMEAGVRRVFAHEIVHACLALTGRWPAWLHEGLAQKFSGETLSAATRQTIARMIQAHALPKLENLGQDWSRLDTQHAAAAYALALEAVETFLENYHDDGLLNLLRNPARLNTITPDLDTRLGLTSDF